MATTLSENEIRQITLTGATLVPRQVQDKDLLQQEVTKVTNLFHQLFSTLRTDITNQHRTAACNLLSTLIEKCAQSTEPHLQLLLWQTQKFWADAFWLYLDQHHSLNVKPSRLLLTSLTSVLAKCQDKAICHPEKARLLELLVQYIATPSENAPTRPAMQALAHWLSKNVVTVDDLCSVFAKVLTLESNATPPSLFHKLLDIILRLAPYEDFASSAGSLAALILQKAPPTGQSSLQLQFGNYHQSPWASTVLDILNQNPRSLENFRHYVFPEIFQQDRASFIAFLEHLSIQNILGTHQPSGLALPLPRSQCEEALFCALSVGSKLGLVKVADISQNTTVELFFEKDVLCIPDVLIGELLLRPSDAMRIAGLAMLTTSTTTTQPLSTGAMDALRKGLPFLHADADAGFRSELFSLIKNLIERIKAATATLAKPQSKTKKTKTQENVESPSNHIQSSELVAAHKSFIEWYVSFLKTELRPTANYQRHVSALRCLSIVAKSGVDARVHGFLFSKSAGPVVAWPFTLNVVDTELTDLLIDLLLNPYDDVRSTAAEILSLVEITPQYENSAETPVMVKVLAQAEDLMKLSGRADHADGVAHLYSILFSRSSVLTNTRQWWESQCGILEHLVVTIEETLRIACEDISKAVNRHPLHGLFISLRYIIERSCFYQTLCSDSSAFSHLQLLYSRLYSIFGDVWKCVYDTLCNDTPEIVAPEEVGEEDIGTKDVLSYSWRALKESSLLLRAIVKNCPLNISDQPLLSSQQLRQLGDLTFSELAELRHRGAFSTVAQTFVICCIRSNSGAETVSEALDNWYQRAILCIQNQTAINTRRSAGLPSLMIGIVVADSKGALFGRAMKELTIEATRPVNQAAESAGGLSQVHALNCIKDIFKNSKLGERSEAYVPEALSLSAKCLSSDTWAVRNSGLMLFRALMDRLIGTNDAYTDDGQPTQTRLSEEAITSLMHVVLELLGPTDGDVNQVNAEVVFPALQLLQRIQPPQSISAKIQASVLRLASNRQWHVRDKAAKTYSILVPAKDRSSCVANLLRKEARTQNEAHGCLLTARYLIERLGKDSPIEDIATLMNAIQSRIDDLLYDNACPLTQAAFVDVQTSFFYAAIQKQRHLFAPGTTWATIHDMSIILELPQEHFAACSFLRQSLALSLIHEYAVFSGPTNENSATDVPARVDVLSSLAARDPDACATALREAARIGSADPMYATQTRELLVKICARLLFDDNVDIEVQDAAQEVLITQMSLGAADTTNKDMIVDLKKSYLPSNAATPLFSDKRLILQGALLDIRTQGDSMKNGQLKDDFKIWVLQVRAALQDTNPFDTRYSAAIATRQLSNSALVHFSAAARSSVLEFCLAVYDLNNDDDDEIRALAAPVATNILNAGSGKKHSDMVSLAANQGLANFIASAFGSSDVAAQSALSRATGNAVNAFFPDSVRESLDEKSNLGSSLFAQEKQNLFIDETREAKIWSSVAAQLHPEAFSFRLLMNLCTWVIDGLDVLTAEINAKPDTPLGWSRKPEVFVLGMQVIHAAELVMKLGKREIEMPVENKAVAKRLEAFLSKGQENGANVLWLQTVKDLLERQI